MSNEIDHLKRNYRQLEAPSHLAARIRAAVAAESSRPRSWIPAAATVVAAVTAVSLATLLIGPREAGVKAPPSSSSSSKTSQAESESASSSAGTRRVRLNNVQLPVRIFWYGRGVRDPPGFGFSPAGRDLRARLPGAGVGHGHPGLGGRQRFAGLQQFDGKYRRANARRPCGRPGAGG